MIFRGRATIANDSVVEVGCNGTLTFGNECRFNGGFRLSCQKEIIFGDSILASWDVSVYDTDFHRMKKCETEEKVTSCTKAVHVGDKCWLGFGTTLMKGARLGNQCTLAARSVLTKDFSGYTNTIFAGNPAMPRKEGFYLDINDCKPEYED